MEDERKRQWRKRIRWFMRPKFEMASDTCRIDEVCGRIADALQSLDARLSRLDGEREADPHAIHRDGICMGCKACRDEGYARGRADGLAEKPSPALVDAHAYARGRAAERERIAKWLETGYEHHALGSPVGVALARLIRTGLDEGGER